MVTFYLGCGADQRLVDRIKFDRKLFEKVKRFGGLGGPTRRLTI